MYVNQRPHLEGPYALRLEVAYFVARTYVLPFFKQAAAIVCGLGALAILQSQMAIFPVRYWRDIRYSLSILYSLNILFSLNFVSVYNACLAGYSLNILYSCKIMRFECAVFVESTDRVIFV